MSDTRSAPLSISTIDVSLARQSQKRVKFIELGTNSNNLKKIETTLQAGDTHKAELTPPLVIASDNHILISARCPRRFWTGYNVVVDIDPRDAGCVHEDKGIKAYRKTIRNVEVVARCSPASLVPGPESPMPTLDPSMPVDPPKLATDPLVPATDPLIPALDPPILAPDSSAPHPNTQVPCSNPQMSDSQAPGKLSPTTEELIRMCARFRILIIGNSGVGKSTLIQRMFGVGDVHASETVRGDADINKEFISGQNQRFVVHDSLGFEAGDARNLEVVRDFVKRRQAMHRLEDQLHAIWLCMEIPHSGGRLVEQGVEQLLKNQRDILGNVPLIVVLTKVDLLDIRLELEAQDNEPAESRRKRHLDEHCIGPLQKAAGRDISCVAVSAKQGYYILISKLMETTRENMANHSIDEAPRAMAAIAQRVDIKEKIEMSIDVGKKQYWNSLLKSAVFRGRTLRECLEVIRKDIVTVWNFIGLDYGLLDEKLIETLVPADISPPIIRSWLSLDNEQFLSDAVKKVASTMSAILNLPYESYKEAILDVEILMSYIVDLICVMQVIFLLAPDGPVTPDIVARAIEFSKDKREQVHNSVKEFDKKRAVRAGGGQDLVLKEVEKLISQYKLSELEMAKLRQEAAPSTINV